jgi:hypothetical protein
MSHENFIHKNGLFKLLNLITFDIVCRQSQWEKRRKKIVIWRHLDRVPRRKTILEVFKRILWVTQDGFFFYSSAHYDIDIGFNLKFFGISASLYFVFVFLMIYIYTILSSDSTFNDFFFVWPKSRQRMIRLNGREDHVQLKPKGNETLLDFVFLEFQLLYHF